MSIDYFIAGVIIALPIGWNIRAAWKARRESS